MRCCCLGLCLRVVARPSSSTGAAHAAAACMAVTACGQCGGGGSCMHVCMYLMVCMYVLTPIDRWRHAPASPHAARAIGRPVARGAGESWSNASVQGLTMVTGPTCQGSLARTDDGRLVVTAPHWTHWRCKGEIERDPIPTVVMSTSCSATHCMRCLAHALRSISVYLCGPSKILPSVGVCRVR